MLKCRELLILKTDTSYQRNSARESHGLLFLLFSAWFDKSSAFISDSIWDFTPLLVDTVCQSELFNKLVLFISLLHRWVQLAAPVGVPLKVRTWFTCYRSWRCLPGELFRTSSPSASGPHLPARVSRSGLSVWPFTLIHSCRRPMCGLLMRARASPLDWYWLIVATRPLLLIVLKWEGIPLKSANQACEAKLQQYWVLGKAVINCWKVHVAERLTDRPF